MKEYILSIDQSTSGTKAILFDREGKLIRRCTLEHRQYYPKPGWVEHDAEEIFERTLQVIHQLLDETGVALDQVEVLAVTNQRETVLVWDRETGKPVYPAIVWQCQRATEICKNMENKGFSDIVKAKSGLQLSPYFSAAKAKWVLDNVEGARGKAEKGQLVLGTMDSWIIWNLTGGKVHATDYSNASRTQLFNIKELKWDDELLEIFTIPRSMLPQVKYSDEIFGYAEVLGGGAKLPISGVMGDSHAALFGQNCFVPGMAKTTYGTGSSIMMNIGTKAKESRKGLVTSIGWGREKSIDYVFEGNINSTGATIKWLAENLELIEGSSVCERIASSVDSSDGVYFVPAFTGLGAPYWESDAKAVLCGMTMGTRKAHIVRAAQDSIAYQIKDVIDLMIEESGTMLSELRVDGGPTRNNSLMKFQADLLEVSIVRSSIEELSALGSAFMAGLAVGFYSSIDEIKALRVEDARFVSTMGGEERTLLYDGWKAAVRKAL